jgi:hypothetical protein
MIIDTNVYVGHWPFRRLPGDELPDLIAKLRSHNVTQAWAGSFEGVLHEDVAGVNERLASACRDSENGLLIPFGTVNPTLPDWREDLRRCHEEHKMPGIRLHPSYHGYTLKDPRFAELLLLATERTMVVQVVLNMEDSRTQHPLARVEEVDTLPLLRLIFATPGLRLMIQNRKRKPSGKLLGRLSYAGETYFDFSMLEGVGAIPKLLKEIPSDRLVFGSYYPFFYFEAALLKAKEAGLDESQGKAILAENAGLILEP